MTSGNFDDVIFSATLVPHRSLGRRGFVVLMAAIAALWFAFGFFLWERGAWPIIGFGGLDILAIYIAFRLNYRAARAFEEIAVSRTEIVVRKVMANGRAQEFRFNPQWVKLEVQEVVDEGVVRIALGRGAFVAYMLKQFEAVPVMPPAFLVPFATVLPYVETLIGLMILVGFRTRTALIAGSLMIAALTFGTMMRQDFTIAWLQLDYAIAFFLLLALRSWNVISIDGMSRGT